MCLILAMLTGRFLFLGGALTCAVIALSQKKWLKKTTGRNHNNNLLKITLGDNFLDIFVWRI